MCLHQQLYAIQWSRDGLGDCPRHTTCKEQEGALQKRIGCSTAQLCTLKRDIDGNAWSLTFGMVESCASRMGFCNFVIADTLALLLESTAS